MIFLLFTFILFYFTNLIFLMLMIQAFSPKPNRCHVYQPFNYFYEDEIILYSVVVLECLTVIIKQNNEYKQIFFF